MKLLSALTALLAPLLFLPSCATRSEFVPESGPVTVGMPGELSDRERTYVGEIESALSRSGYLPVRHRTGELALDFRISPGPINTDTRIELRDGGNTLARGTGRSSGVPLVGRDRRADESFRQAMEDFQATLPQASAARGPAPSQGPGGEMEYVY